MDSSVKFVPLLVGLLLAVIMVGAVFVPVVQSSTTQTITTEIENEGSEWLKLGYNEGEDYSFTVGYETVTVDEVETEVFKVGTQTGEYKNLICYADNERTLFVSGDYWYLLTNGEPPSVYQFTDNASVTNASGTLTILDGSETVYTGASPTWAYVPDANGVYGFFTGGGLNLEEGKPKVAVGEYAGVFTYNNIIVSPTNTDLGLVMVGDYANGEVVWNKPSSSVDTLDIHSTTENASLRSADPSDSTRVGDLYYKFTDNNATVTGYASGTDWTTLKVIPDTVEYNGVTYNVTNVSNYAFYSVTDLALTTLSSNLTNVGNSAFALTHASFSNLPEGLTTIGSETFRATNVTFNALPSSLTTVGSGAFYQCQGLTSLIIQSSPTIASNSFYGCNNLKTILNLGQNEITTTSYGLSADEVRTDIPALGYIAPTSIHETEVIPIDSPVAGLMQMLPLIAGVGALLLAVGTMIYTRF